MVTEAIRTEADFTRLVEADFIVALKAKSGRYELFLEAFTRRNGRAYLRYTAKLEEAYRFSKWAAEDALKAVREYKITGRVERVSPDNSVRSVVDSGEKIFA